VPYRHLPALASRLLPPTVHAPTPGGWNVASFGVDEECESPIREIRQAVFFPQDLKEEEEGLLQDLRDLGIPVDRLFAAKGVTSEVNAQICRGDVAEYVGAALIHDEGVRLERLWAKNFHKLKASHSEIGVDVVGVNLADIDGPLGEDELVVFVFAKHSLQRIFERL
jgi:hypothetical protein